MITITGSSASDGSSAAKTSSPPRPGIFRSSRTASGESWATFARASSPSAASRVWYPSERKKRTRLRRIVRSSSATRMVAGADISEFSVAFACGNRECECKDRAGAVGPVGGTQFTAVGQGNFAGDRQAQAGSLGLGCVERLEHMFKSVRRPNQGRYRR